MEQMRRRSAINRRQKKGDFSVTWPSSPVADFFRVKSSVVFCLIWPIVGKNVGVEAVVDDTETGWRAGEMEWNGRNRMVESCCTTNEWNGLYTT